MSEEKSDYKRPSWDEYFLAIVKEVATRATCDRGRTGCVIVKDKRILTTGYVGSPIGLPHCDEAGHQYKKTVHEDGKVSNHCVRTIHAEQNAICQAARNGIPLDGATIYCILEPCFVCAKMIVNAGIKKVVCEKRYHAGQDTRDVLDQAGVKLVALSEELQKYDNQ
ncbi:cell division protein DedD [Candidatus Woesearchaeota archaeon]|jgi:dCMP deaminase|nr:cell division protein DedD [Candidatus Woesearchaeota archaeon]MBT7928893.1 cell division protein DedD [Candidatus Peregrinibacteria bacterium]MBT3537633.1 cell division protein DedD [Candidatus Woesearchaeota archaeon]MBT4698433.1 cell division protein DedD [Candidatus Woesearchaeota archaeon]MBT4716658.1 cell division protein DedD [Candidatus Woesearchaeota archaeon]